MIRKSLVLMAVLLALSGCAKTGDTAKTPLSERERDSVLARQPLPGASAVGEAMDQADRQTDAARTTDAMVDSLPR